jgi:hypothetical protein
MAVFLSEFKSGLHLLQNSECGDLPTNNVASWPNLSPLEKKFK